VDLGQSRGGAQAKLLEGSAAALEGTHDKVPQALAGIGPHQGGGRLLAGRFVLQAGLPGVGQGGGATVAGPPGAVSREGEPRPLAQGLQPLPGADGPVRVGLVGQQGARLAQGGDEEVIACLEHARPPVAAAAAAVQADDPPLRDEEVNIQTGPVRLGGRLTVPETAVGVVVFAHGSGSSSRSSRNRYVAAVLNQAGLATLLFDLLTPGEEIDRANVFDVELLARRLGQVTAWLRSQPETRDLMVGYFGASTGAAAALWAASEPDAHIAAVVSRGGRPDLAGPRLAAVTAPTLLIVGSRDLLVLDLNRQARAQLCCESSLAVVPGATHLFEEDDTLRAAAELTRDWFTDHLAGGLRPKEMQGTESSSERR